MEREILHYVENADGTILGTFRHHRPVDTAAFYQKLHLWLRLPDTAQNAMPENLNLQIGRLLKRYKSL